MEMSQQELKVLEQQLEDLSKTCDALISLEDQLRDAESKDQDTPELRELLKKKALVIQNISALDEKAKQELIVAINETFTKKPRPWWMSFMTFTSMIITLYVLKDEWNAKTWFYTNGVYIFFSIVSKPLARRGLGSLTFDAQAVMRFVLLFMYPFVVLNDGVRWLDFVAVGHVLFESLP